MAATREQVKKTWIDVGWELCYDIRSIDEKIESLKERIKALQWEREELADELQGVIEHLTEDCGVEPEQLREWDSLM